jgi:hypothetical protein
MRGKAFAKGGNYDKHLSMATATTGAGAASGRGADATDHACAELSALSAKDEQVQMPMTFEVP